MLYGANMPEKPIDGLAEGYDDELIRGYREDCQLERQIGDILKPN